VVKRWLPKVTIAAFFPSLSSRRGTEVTIHQLNEESHRLVAEAILKIRVGGWNRSEIS
jgi:hypothetical protein